MTLLLPKLNRPTAGMTLRRTGWCVTWKEDGKWCSKSLGTKDTQEALVRRDEEREALIARGAVVRTENTRNIDPKGLRYVYRRQPYEVKLPKGQYVGFFDTEAEAIAARNKALGI